MKRTFFALLSCFMIFGIAGAQADTLLINAMHANPVNAPSGLVRPQNGSSMETVQSKFGAPIEEINWVGEPPITRWVYPNFTVYFEGELVIHSVVHQKTAAGQP